MRFLANQQGRGIPLPLALQPCRTEPACRSIAHQPSLFCRSQYCADGFFLVRTDFFLCLVWKMDDISLDVSGAMYEEEDSCEVSTHRQNHPSTEP